MRTSLTWESSSNGREGSSSESETSGRDDERLLISPDCDSPASGLESVLGHRQPGGRAL